MKTRVFEFFFKKEKRSFQESIIHYMRVIPFTLCAPEISFSQKLFPQQQEVREPFELPYKVTWGASQSLPQICQTIGNSLGSKNRCFI